MKSIGPHSWDAVSTSNMDFIFMAPTGVITHNTSFYHTRQDIRGDTHKQEASKLATTY